MATKPPRLPNLAQAKRDAKRSTSEPAVISLPLRSIRILLGYSVREFAALLSESTAGRGWSAAQICRVEAGKRIASPELDDAIKSFISLHVPSSRQEIQS